jgi:hypothetical protein
MKLRKSAPPTRPPLISRHTCCALPDRFVCENALTRRKSCVLSQALSSLLEPLAIYFTTSTLPLHLLPCRQKDTQGRDQNQQNSEQSPKNSLVYAMYVYAGYVHQTLARWRANVHVFSNTVSHSFSLLPSLLPKIFPSSFLSSLSSLSLFKISFRFSLLSSPSRHKHTHWE